MKKWWLFVAVLLVAGIALGLRLQALRLLPIDYDEDDYLGAAQRYAQALRAGDMGEIISYEYNFEHPPLTKLIVGLAIAPLPEAPLLPEQSSTMPPAGELPQPHFNIARTVSVLFGTLEVLALAILNPLAGFFLAIHTWQIKYTSQIMLEPLPALTSLLVVLFYLRSKGKLNGWLVLSGVALGITAAAKYPYCIVGVAILADWLWSNRVQRMAGESEKPGYPGSSRPVLAWILAALVIFILLDPRLWAESLSRLIQSVIYHWDYAHSGHVRQAGFPAWQPLVWLSMPVPWHPGLFLFAWDFLITLLAILGFQRMWRKQRVFGLWLAMALGFLLVWPTKWPQYLLILTAPLSLAAAEGFMGSVWAPAEKLVKHWRDARQSRHLSAEARANRAVGWRDARRALPWLLPGMVGLSLIALFPLIFQGAMALTDFNATSIRDGIQGGVWRAAWQGLTGQEKPVEFDVLQGSRAKQVRYAGPGLLIGLLSGGVAEILVFNVIWTVLSVTLQVILGVLVALVLSRPGVRLRGFWSAIFILPWAIPEFVGALVWLRIFEPRYGWLALAQNLPLDVSSPSWFENPNQTLLILLVAATWYGFPFIMLAALAGFKLMPYEVYDAAALDGAGGWRLFKHIIWPLLMPLVIPAIIIRSIFAFNQFYLFIALRTDYPLVTFATLSYYLFAPTGYFGGQFAVSAAINIITVIVLVVLIVWFNRVSRASEGVTYA